MLDRLSQTGARRRARLSGRATFVAALVATTLLAASCAQRAATPPPDEANGWLEFDGTSNGTGTRHTIPLGGGRSSSVVALKGTMLLAGPGRPGVGFLSESVALVDSASGLVGRSVWTDEHGDQVYSELSGEGTAANNRIEGTIVGGTGRYTDAIGTYSFSWQYVLEGEDGAVQSRAVGLHGRVRVGQQSTGGRP